MMQIVNGYANNWYPSANPIKQTAVTVKCRFLRTYCAKLRRPRRKVSTTTAAQTQRGKTIKICLPAQRTKRWRYCQTTVHNLRKNSITSPLWKFIFYFYLSILYHTSSIPQPHNTSKWVEVQPLPIFVF